MKITISRILNKLNYQSIFSLSKKTELIWPEETITSDPAIYLQSNLENIIAPISGSNIALETDRLLGNQCRHDATTAYYLEDINVEGEYLHKNFCNQRYVTN